MIRLLGTSVANSGKKVQAVRGIKKELEEDVAGRNPIKTLFDFQVRFGYYRLEEIKALQKTDSMGRLGDNINKRRNDYDHKNNPKRGRGGRGSYSNFSRSCYMCNGGAHREVECWLFNHPDGNHENKPFEYSSKGALWKAKGYDRLPHNLKLDDSAWEDAQQFAQRPSFYRGGRGPTPYRGGRFNGRGRGGRFEGRSNQSEFTNDSNTNNKRNRENEVELLNSINENNDNNFLVDVNIFPQEVGEAEEDSNSIRVGTLFDSGALNNNYMHQR